MKKIVKITAGVAAAALLVYSFIPEPLKVDMVPVVRGDIQVVLEAEGKTRIHDVYTVSTPIDGRVTRIESEVGNRVTAGQSILANMHPSNPQFLDKRSEIQAKADADGAKAALSLAAARVKQAKVAKEYGQSQFKRAQELFEKKLIPIAQLEQAELHLKNLKAELETAQSTQQVQAAALKTAETRLLQPEAIADNEDDNCQICIKAPVDGLVLEVIHKSESIVPVGTPLLRIGDPEDMEIELEMLSTNAVKVSEGDMAVINRWGQDDPIKAQVLVIEPFGFTKVSALGVEEQRVKVILSFIDPYEKWQALGHGFRVEAGIVIDEADDAVIVPLSALFREQGQWSVFKLDGSSVVLTAVEIGRKNDLEAEVISGLSVDDTVVVHPAVELSDGSRVKAR